MLNWEEGHSRKRGGGELFSWEDSPGKRENKMAKLKEVSEKNSQKGGDWRRV